jgi:hypothetical protein
MFALPGNGFFCGVLATCVLDGVTQEGNLPPEIGGLYRSGLLAPQRLGSDFGFKVCAVPFAGLFHALLLVITSLEGRGTAYRVVQQAGPTALRAHF